MNRRRTALLQSGLKALYYSGAYRLMSPWTRGLGIIFTLHHIAPEPPAAFSPNRILTVAPDFLAAAIERVREAGLEILSLDEMLRRLREGDGGRFACFTIDDGYRDNLVHAHPVFERHEAPYAIYVSTGLPDHTARLWWEVLERAVADRDTLRVRSTDGEETLAAGTVEEKYDAYERLYWRVRGLEPAAAADFVSAVAASAGVDETGPTVEAALSWEEIRTLSGHPLVTIGAHTLTHPQLAKVSETEASYEMAESRRVIAEETGVRPRHFAYPYGSPEAAGPREFALAERLGFATAVTTRPGLLFAAHRSSPWSLPRVSLNGDYQDLRYLDLFLSGAPFALAGPLGRARAA